MFWNSVSVVEKLPDFGQPVWLLDGTRIFPGCRMEYIEEIEHGWNDEGWQWVEVSLSWGGGDWVIENGEWVIENGDWVIEDVHFTNPKPTHWAQFVPPAPK